MKINLLELKLLLKRIPEILLNKVILFFFILILFNLLIGSFVYYKYSFLVLKKEITVTDNGLMLEQELLNNIINKLDEREKSFQETETKIYPDLFKPKEETERGD
ncbi:MAG: hypothetical protein ISS87_01290 [Candidatus Pacebacteria bacterium]|nr:hypothetical protein [Candidatus Paceibacterota bacterium]